MDNFENLPLPAVSSRSCMNAGTKRYKYFRRIFKFDQMDFEFAFWQMLYLFVAPQKVFRNCHYRKQTKSQFARDDPAFLVLFSICLCLTTVGFSIVLNLTFLQFIVFLLYIVFVDCILIGMIIATIFWIVLNRYLRPKNQEEVEWGFSFDVHLNAFFPPLILLHFFQLFFYNGFISHEWFISRWLGNTFWLVAALYYLYITFLGYNSLQILPQVRFILSSVPAILFIYMVTLIANINATQLLMDFYKHRVV